MARALGVRTSHLIRTATALALAIALVVVLVGGGERARDAKAAAVHCRPGTVPAAGPVAGAAHREAHASDAAGSAAPRACVLIGQPETFADLGTANAQLGARDAAPFAHAAAGAFPAAYAQKRALPVAHAAGAAAAWHLAGSPPECAAPTNHGRTCPAAGPDNGGYGYTGTLGLRTLSGRITSFAYDPSTQGRYFASPTVGGVWESTDSGTSWRSIGDGLPTQVIGAMAYDQPFHRVIAGSGDNSFGGDGIAGHGVYYSDDDGGAWRLAAGIPDLALSFRVVVSPADPKRPDRVRGDEQGSVPLHRRRRQLRQRYGCRRALEATPPTAKATPPPRCASSPTSSPTLSSRGRGRPTPRQGL